MKVIAVLALASAFSVSPAWAEPRTGYRVPVPHADLDLGQWADAEQMARRLDEAARRVCGGGPHFHRDHRAAPIWTAEAFETCRTAALGAALTALNAPLVTEAAASRASP